MNEQEIIEEIRIYKEGLQALEDKLKKVKEENEIVEPLSGENTGSSCSRMFPVKTEGQVDVLVRKLTILQDIQGLRLALGDGDFEHEGSRSWYPYYDRYHHEWRADWFEASVPFPFPFSSKENCEKACRYLQKTYSKGWVV